MCISVTMGDDTLERERVGRVAYPGPQLAAPRSEALPRNLLPGQLWRVEAPIGAAASAPLRRVLAAANVVVYDRVLAPLVAAALPPGGYAEPAAAGDGATDPASERCTRFARDGWSVVRLVAAPRERVTLVIDAADGAAPRLHAVAANGLAG